jgi:hypothetical protein
MKTNNKSVISMALGWVGAGLLGWFCYRLLLTISADGRLQQVFLGIAVTLAVVVGYGLVSILNSRNPISGEWHRRLSLGANWGVAAAAGWNIAVMVGGPMSGLATAIYAQRLFEGRVWLLAGMMIAAIVVGRIAMELPGGTGLIIGGTWCALGVAAFTYGAVRLLDGAQAALVSAFIVAWWGFAWVLAYWAKNVVSMPDLGGYGVNSLELVIAFGVGGAVAGRPWFDVGRISKWMLGGLVAALVGIVIDLGITAAVSGPGVLFSGAPQFLDAGQVVGMGFGAMLAAGLSQPKTNETA